MKQDMVTQGADELLGEITEVDKSITQTLQSKTTPV